MGPWRLAGKVVQGFQRGSKQLGWPTANLDSVAFEDKLDASQEGVYIGWAKIHGGKTSEAQRVHKAVLSIGWNPFYKNKERTVEAYIDHKFEEDFYGERMSLVICAFLRPQQDFDSLESLVEAISEDIRVGLSGLDTAPFSGFRCDSFFELRPGNCS